MAPSGSSLGAAYRLFAKNPISKRTSYQAISLNGLMRLKRLLVTILPLL